MTAQPTTEGAPTTRPEPAPGAQGKPASTDSPQLIVNSDHGLLSYYPNATDPKRVFDQTGADLSHFAGEANQLIKYAYYSFGYSFHIDQPHEKFAVPSRTYSQTLAGDLEHRVAELEANIQIVGSAADGYAASGRKLLDILSTVKNHEHQLDDYLVKLSGQLVDEFDSFISGLNSNVNDASNLLKNYRVLRSVAQRRAHAAAISALGAIQLIVDSTGEQIELISNPQSVIGQTAAYIYSLIYSLLYPTSKPIPPATPVPRMPEAT